MKNQKLIFNYNNNTNEETLADDDFSESLTFMITLSSVLMILLIAMVIKRMKRIKEEEAFQLGQKVIVSEDTSPDIIPVVNEEKV